MPGTEDQLIKEMTSGYVGFDPTADSLHIGSLVPILLLVHLQKAGHKPLPLLAEQQAWLAIQVGKAKKEILLSEEILNKNLEWH